MEAVETKIADVPFRLAEIEKDLKNLIAAQRERDAEDQRRRAEAVKDRKADRKWQATVLAAWASAIIAAVAIIVPLLVG